MMTRTKEESKDVEPVYKIEVPANRYDLLSLEGISNALRAYLGKGLAPKYTVGEMPENPITITVKPETAAVRPFVVSAVLRNITFTESTYHSFIEVQDLLHNNICRRRTLASMGTHDLDKVKGTNITYEALPPKDISFTALKQKDEMTAEKLFEVLSKDIKLRPYLKIIKDKPNYPVFYDESRQVLSLPPIINSDDTKIDLNTKNCLVEITATDHNRAKIALAILVSQFSEYCGDQYTVEPVKIIYPDGKVEISPEFPYREFTVNLNYCNKILGIDMKMDDISALL